MSKEKSLHEIIKTLTHLKTAVNGLLDEGLQDRFNQVSNNEELATFVTKTLNVRLRQPTLNKSSLSKLLRVLDKIICYYQNNQSAYKLLEKKLQFLFIPHFIPQSKSNSCFEVAANAQTNNGYNTISQGKLVFKNFKVNRATQPVLICCIIEKDLLEKTDNRVSKLKKSILLAHHIIGLHALYSPHPKFIKRISNTFTNPIYKFFAGNWNFSQEELLSHVKDKICMLLVNAKDARNNAPGFFTNLKDKLSNKKSDSNSKIARLANYDQLLQSIPAKDNWDKFIKTTLELVTTVGPFSTKLLLAINHSLQILYVYFDTLKHNKKSHLACTKVLTLSEITALHNGHQMPSCKAKSYPSFKVSILLDFMSNVVTSTKHVDLQGHRDKLVESIRNGIKQSYYSSLSKINKTLLCFAESGTSELVYYRICTLELGNALKLISEKEFENLIKNIENNKTVSTQPPLKQEP